jgi:REP element-mobilizing transposase RayT
MSRESYKGANWFFVTVCCHQGRPTFSTPAVAASIERVLCECAAKHGFLLHAWCVMPNHVHFLAKGTKEDSDLVAFVTGLKQQTAYQAKREFGVQLWQRSFYDHLVRRAEIVPRIAAYIWGNPVRKHLCTDPSEYPFSGSMTVEWKRKVSAPDKWDPPWNTGRA